MRLCLQNKTNERGEWKEGGEEGERGRWREGKKNSRIVLGMLNIILKS